jgi:hypothetical protein
LYESGWKLDGSKLFIPSAFRFLKFNSCLLDFMQSTIDVTAFGPLFWDLMALQDVLAAIEIQDALQLERRKVLLKKGCPGWGSG